MSIRPVRFLLLLGAVLFAACDASTTAPVDDDGDSDVLAEAPPSEGTTLADLAEEASQAEEPEFTVLFAALQAAGLDEVLDGNRAFTVFAPTDDAFEAFLANDELLTRLGTTAGDLLDDEDLLREVLLHHVVPGKRDAEEVLESEQIRTQQGGFIFPTVDDEGTPFIVDGSDETDDAEIIDTDLEASNGILHVIDQVLVPGPGSTPGGHDGEDEDEDEDERSDLTMAELLQQRVDEAAAAEEGSQNSFTVLLAALEAAGLSDALGQKGQLTVFAPTDAAFGPLLDYLEMSQDDLLADEELLREVLLHHVARGRRYAEDVLDSDQIRTLQGDFIFPVVVDDVAYIVDGTEETADAEIIETDLEARNGIIHVIAEVLVPGPGSTPGGHDDDEDDDGDEEDEGNGT